jgi:alpha-ribazole phosphatase/probable phosphoglycerate mutase
MSDASTITTTRLWLIRHGEPVPEVRGRCYGRLDVGLSAEGRCQVERVAQRLEAEPLHAICASPRRRTLESARILASARACGVQVEEDLREIDFGDFEGLPYEQIAERYPEIYRQWMEHPTEVEFPNGESFVKMCARVTRSIAALLARHAGDCVAVVTHSGVIRIVLADALGMPAENLFRIGQGFAAANLIRYVGGYPVVESINGGV